MTGRKPAPALEDFPLKAYDKLRYGDTDRQGHVNNAVFATLLETGRVEMLCDPAGPMNDPGCAFVLASMHLELVGEISWPGRVEIGTRVSSVGRSSFGLEQGLFQNGRCVGTAKSVVVQMNEATRRAHPLSDAMKVKLEGWSRS